MATFKCKMCGGELQAVPGMTVAECEYCGTRQTLPKLDDDRKANLYDRANHFRRNNDFDKAMGIYEQILNEDGTDAEAYWSLVLCRYGIEYVEDPKTRKRIPTVNRVQFTAVFDDDNYKSALQYADLAQRQLYEAEAKAINEIQKEILAISQKEEPFDVFICYKETDSNGRRTPDSVLATELYHQLVREGFKVFFSRITLEDKLGTAYEPYIFAALNSAKVMVVLGTRPEYFQAVWVKNEWSRYLSLIKQGQQKILIPAYRDMDPYDLPEEFSHLQAQDMSKLGFMQDLLYGIKKLVRTAAPQSTVVKETVITASGVNTEVLLKRVFIFLEDGDWNAANEYCEKVLDIDPECAKAYLGKLMAQLKVKKQENLKNCMEPFDQNGNYQKAVRYGDETLKKTLAGYVAHIAACNKKAQLEWVYQNVLHNMANAQNEQQYTQAAHQFEQLGAYKDAAQQAKACLEKAAELRRNAEEQRIAAARRAEEERLAAERKAKKRKKILAIVFLSLAAVIALTIVFTKAILPANHYHKAVALMEAGQYPEAIAAFEALEGYRDSREKLEVCREGILQVRYDEAVTLMEAGQFDTACAAFEALDGYKDSLEKLEVCREGILQDRYDEAVALMEAGNTTEAALRFGALGDYHDAKAQSMRLWEQIADRKTIAAGRGHTVGLKADGTVVAMGYNDDGQCDVKGWTDIVAIAAGGYHTIGLKADGTVVAVGLNNDGQCDVKGWTDIVAIAAGGYHTVGLKADGTVVAVGSNGITQCDVNDWTDIVAIGAGNAHTLGLRTDGTVVAVGFNDDGLCDVDGWTDIVAVDAGSYHTVGLKIDGTVVSVGDNVDNQRNVGGWTDVVAIAAHGYHTVGLKADGTVVAVGLNVDGQCYVANWSDIVAIAAGGYHTVGLKADGTMVAIGAKEDGQCDVDGWKNIKVPE